jgi:branched-subunit amino acid transport protein AzlD
VPAEATGAVLDFDRHFRRAVWITTICVVFGAGVVYAGKAADDRSAFIRWRHQVLQFWAGENIYDAMMFPNPPIMPITLLPFMLLPPVPGALCWFALKAVLTGLSVWYCFRMARPPGTKVLPSYVQAIILLLSFRPILSDLHHGNNNLIILFLVVASLYAWRKGYDVLAGLVLALAISYKVTPALFVPYYLYKRSWRTVGATFLGMGVFLLIVPSLVIGPQFNGECLAVWWQRMISPFLTKGEGSPQEINQSMVGVLTRLLTDVKMGPGRYDVHMDLNLVAWPRPLVGLLLKALSVGLVGLLAFFCRTRAERRDDPRLLGEFSLIVLTMLFVSERSWKHHYVTLLLPYTYLTYRVFMGEASRWARALLATALALSALLIATTSSEFGGLFADGQGHKIAQGYGMFLWAGVVLYIATAWRLWVERGHASVDKTEYGPLGRGPHLPALHLADHAHRPFAS